MFPAARRKASAAGFPAAMMVAALPEAMAQVPSTARNSRIRTRPEVPQPCRTLLRTWLIFSGPEIPASSRRCAPEKAM